MEKLSIILVLNGPNLNLLGIREKTIYGSYSLKQVEKTLKSLARELKCEVDFFQSNHEGDLIDKIQDSYNRYTGIIINAGAYTHTSIAIMDALRVFSKPIIEVHMSNIYSRENFRTKSYISYIADGSVCGFGALSYNVAMRSIVRMFEVQFN